MLYLIMRCDELNDQYECDANRTPVAIVKDWEDWAYNHLTDYDYEVWQYGDDGHFSCIKDYNDAMEKGMALYYWNKDEDCEEIKPHIITKFPSFTRENAVPSVVTQTIRKGAYTWYDEEGVDDELFSCGYISWSDKDENYYVYGEYNGNHYNLGY